MKMFVNLQFEKCSIIVILFPLWLVVLSSYCFCIGHLHSCKQLVQIFLLTFLFLFVWCVSFWSVHQSSLYIVNMILWSLIIEEHVCSQPLTCLFILFLVSSHRAAFHLGCTYWLLNLAFTTTMRVWEYLPQFSNVENKTLRWCSDLLPDANLRSWPMCRLWAWFNTCCSMEAALHLILTVLLWDRSYCSCKSLDSSPAPTKGNNINPSGMLWRWMR